MKKTYLTLNNIKKIAKKIMDYKLANNEEEAEEEAVNVIVFANSFNCSIDSYLADLEFKKCCKENNI